MAKRTKQAEAARNRVIARGRAANFASMTRDDFNDWIQSLPLDEFTALIDLQSEFFQAGAIEPPSEVLAVADLPAKPPADGEHAVSVEADTNQVLVPDDDAWLVYTNEDGEAPLPEDEQCFVLFLDGGAAGPNRSDAFLWGGNGSARIIAYQSALTITWS